MLKSASGAPVAASAPSPSGRFSRSRINEAFTGFTFLTPAMLLIAIFLFYPIAFVIYISLTRWNLLGTPQFVGFDNFEFLLNDPRFGRAVVNTVAFVVMAVPAQLALGLYLAVLINRAISGRAIFRTLFFIPLAVSFPAAGIIFRSIFNTNDVFTGIVPVTLQNIGLGFPDWQGRDGEWALPVIVLMNTWKSAGYAMVIYLAGLQSINSSLYEAAEVDGAKRGWQMFRFITWPLLLPTTFLLVVTTTIFSFRAFEPMFVMTRGGPAGATTTLVYYGYDFRTNLAGIASASSVILLIIVIALTIIQFAINRRIQESME